MVLQPDILVGGGVGEKHTPLEALGCRRCSVFLVSEGLTLDCWDVERCVDPLG